MGVDSDSVDDPRFRASTVTRLLSNLPVVAWAVDQDLKFTFSAGAALLALGLRPGQVVGSSLYEFLGTQDPEHPAIAAHLQALSGRSAEFELANGGRIFSSRVEPVDLNASDPIGAAVGTAVDVTHQRMVDRSLHEREAEVRELRRHEGTGRLTGPLVQELTGQLGSALSTLSQLRATLAARPGGDPSVDRTVESALRSVERAVAICTQLVGISAPAVREELGGGETILVVDDESTVRGFVRTALEHLGYRVLESEQGTQALIVGESYPGDIHLLLTDVVLPGMNGPQLAARMAPLRPEMRILYMTGYADNAVVNRGVLSAGQLLLVKPFTTLGLAHEVKKALRS